MNHKHILANPVHITPQQIAYIYDLLNNNLDDYQITLSPKADGITSIIKYKKYDLLCENINNKCYVFDTLSYPVPHSNTLFNRMKWINRLFNYNIEHIAYNIEDINEFIKYNNIINDIIIKPAILLKITGDEFINIINSDAITEYLTDGWIISIYHNNIMLYNNPLKIKPDNMMTLDLLFNGNNFITSDNTIVNNISETDNCIINRIYRCKYDDEIKKFKPIDIRTDKTNPNNDVITNMIITYHTNTHKNRWKPIDILPYIDNKNLYYTHNLITKNIDQVLLEYLEIRKNYMYELLTKNILETDIILDIGCGNGSILKNKPKLRYKKYIGIDKDYCCLNKIIYNIKNNDLIIWGDILLPIWGYFDDSIYKYKYDVIIMNNVIQLYQTLDNLINNINKICKSTTKIIINMLDKSKLSNINYKDQLIIKKLTDKRFFFKYQWIDKEFEENIYSYDEIKMCFENNGFTANLYDNYDIKNMNSEILSYHLSHTTFIFIKNV